MAVNHRWRFFRSGGVDQVALRGGDDLIHLDELDQKLWVALAMPSRGVELDARTLELLDTDKDGRIRVPEVVEAIRFVRATLKDPEELLTGGDSMPLASICEGPVLAGARRILENLGRSGAVEISLTDVADTAKIFSATRFNGDGVIPVESADSEESKQAIVEILATHGAVIDRGGKPGVNRETVGAFFIEVDALVAWGEAAAKDASLERHAAAAAAMRPIRAKVDDYFTRCRLAAFDPRATAQLTGPETEYAALANRDLGVAAPELLRMPLARIEAGRALPLGDGINPAWAEALATLATAAVAPLVGVGRSSLSESEWRAMVAAVAPYDAWIAARPAGRADQLGIDRARILAVPGVRAQIISLIEQDAALAEEYAQIESIERLIRYRRDLNRLLHNFVNFADFYGRRGAIFQAGTLFLDGRACSLCVEVTDPARHGALAGMAATYLAYCDCTRPGGEKMTIAAAFTNGDSDNLVVGRNGVFYDRKGRDWDATISKIISNPISLREAFWSPYKKFVQLVEDQFGKRAAAAEKDAHGRLDTAATATVNADKTKSPDEHKIDVGTVAAIGVAIGGIGAMVTGILAAFFGLGVWMPIGIVALLAMISGPSMLLGWLKLRRRNLGPILDAGGWAINGRAKINVPFGAALTDLATLPKSATRFSLDPYAEKGRPWRTYGALLLIVGLSGAWYLGKLDGYLPSRVRSASVLGTYSPVQSAESDKKEPKK